jgi:hypothetical protein
LAAIPEAAPAQVSARRSKRRAVEADEEVGISAEHCKALRNEDNSNDCSPSSLINSYVVVSNLNPIGICLGDDDVSVDKSVSSIKEMALGSKQECIPISLKDKVLEKEEEVLEEEGLEKLFLKNICSEIMEDVMDLRVSTMSYSLEGIIIRKVTGRGGNKNNFS